MDTFTWISISNIPDIHVNIHADNRADSRSREPFVLLKANMHISVAGKAGKFGKPNLRP